MNETRAIRQYEELQLYKHRQTARVHKDLKPGSIDRPPYFAVIDLRLKTGCH